MQIQQNLVYGVLIVPKCSNVSLIEKQVHEYQNLDFLKIESNMHRPLIHIEFLFFHA